MPGMRILGPSPLPADPLQDRYGPINFYESGTSFEYKKCMFDCLFKKVVRDVIVGGVLAGAAFAASMSYLVSPYAIVEAVYYYQAFGKAYTLIKVAYYATDCAQQCKDCK
jgi:hypothetical protein